MPLPRITLKSCPKCYTTDLDKAVSPQETVNKVTARLASLDLDIFRETRRIDVGRLGIPVYLSVCGEEARRVMPTRKQMGKGSSPEQAQASALMELMERYAFFSFWEESRDFVLCTFAEAQRRFGADCIPLAEINKSVHDAMGPRRSLKVMSCVRWKFYPATRLSDGKTVWLPLDWFRLLSEFNGTSAGNTEEESLLQGLSELVERHVCCRIDREKLTTPTIDPASAADPVLKDLIDRFDKEGVCLVLKDFSLGMPLPTVGAIAWDPATLPGQSEIVFTAGTASSPAKAAIRAVTEVAQLAGDFCTSACYEASGLPKFASLDEAAWVLNGETTRLEALPSVEADDIRDELLRAVEGLKPVEVYAVATTNKKVGVPAHYVIAPGLDFRERDKNQSIGLFVGRKVSEEQTPEEARRNLETIATVYPVAHFLPFYAGMLSLREQRFQDAFELFASAIDRQPESDAKALAAFYAGYALTLEGKWDKAESFLETAAELCPGMKEYLSYLGVARFKGQKFAKAAEAFRAVLKLDKGSAIDLANLGLCEKLTGETEQARAHLEGALEIDPSIEFARTAFDELDGLGDASAG
ncbi:MAG: YcaO-like family protein [Desulfovibrio sp.]|nr:YcaO-like family protein [Desulfovibrio sp.]